MAVVDFTIKQGDTGISLSATLSDENGAVNLTGGSTVFSMRKKTSKEMVVSARSATQVTPTSGVVRYDFVAGDVDEAGDFEGEFVHTTSGGKEITFPRSALDNQRYINIKILEAVA